MAEPINPPAEENKPIGVANDNAPETVSKSQFDAVVSELKELRAKKVSDGVPTVDVDKKIADALKARESEEAGKNWQKAQDNFIAKHKEFHPDNDTGGVKKAALDHELSLLNRNGLSSIEDLEMILEKASILANPNNRQQVERVRLYPSLPRSNADPKSTNASELAPNELRMIEQLGWTEERYLKLKAKDPTFVENALRNAR